MSERSGISLLIRNISRRMRSDELRKTFEEFGDVRDVYIPRDFHTREVKGFAFVEFKNERDAEEALRNLDGSRLDGREITVVFAQEKRKSTDEMRTRERKPRREERSRSRGGSPARHSGRSRSRSRGRPRNNRRQSRSRSPVKKRSRSAQGGAPARRNHSSSGNRSFELKSRSPAGQNGLDPSHRKAQDVDMLTRSPLRSQQDSEAAL
uniref:Splicing factor putative n=1 Tax=Albugo laibachii Nc14 TaxID=890382 RepID=F0VZD6_9STRA|nr:splicing factor putative [Albugo laibachii Nc14]|eukprot:CCA14166.1 splicing factor putative [Albugo laibachii Nc14]